MVVLGLLLGTVGQDLYTGTPRFSFGGPPPMVDGAIRTLLASGMSVGSIRYDKFG
jgi:TctA family transporter